MGEKDVAYQGIFALHVLVRERLSVMIHELELSTDLWSSDTLCSFRDSFSLHARLFISEVEDESNAGGEEETTGRV
jgi:hypothetical protein